MSERDTRSIADGPTAAALVAGGIGTAVLGLLVVLAEASGALGDALVFYAPTGSLSGKAIVAVVVWLTSWGVLHRLWATKDVDLGRMVRITAVLVALGLLGTFPPFFYLFG